MPHDPLDYFFSLERLGMKFGLENITRLTAALGDPHHAFRSVIVAGTNGKGSVTAMVETGLRAAGHRTGRYTSPHLTHLEERFAIDGRDVSTAALRDAAGRVRDAAERVLAEAPPTFFEFATACAFVLFRDAGVEIAVLEVGLGGRLDATNVVSPMAAAITSIDFDHQAQLGDTLASIAREKAGVIKGAIPVVCGPVPPEAERVVREACSAAGASLVMVTPEVLLAAGGAQPALRGAHQRTNAAVAIGLLREIDKIGVAVTEPAIRSAIADVCWPGRLEPFRFRGAQVLLDAAHNPAAARALAAFLRDSGWTDCALVFASMQDKDATAMLAALAPVAGVVVCTRAPTPRAASADELAAIAGRVALGRTVEAINDPAAALDRACALRPHVAAAGSIFLIGPLRDILRAS